MEKDNNKPELTANEIAENITERLIDPINEMVEEKVKDELTLREICVKEITNNKLTDLIREEISKYLEENPFCKHYISLDDPPSKEYIIVNPDWTKELNEFKLEMAHILAELLKSYIPSDSD